MRLFNSCDPKKTLPYKLLVMVIMGIGFPIVCDVIGFHESKYIGIIFFGFMCHYHWKHDKPEKELGTLWAFLQNALFGTVGASVMFDKIESSMIGQGVLITICGVVVRWLATFTFTFK